MIIVAVDDLLFSSKIRQTARQLGVDLAFARTSDAIVERCRAERPALVVFDLDGARMEPIATVARLKADPSLAGIPTLGFVSHVHAGLIDAARDAGIDRVLARSAFAATLPDILAASR
jgi:CheY-like chemotaxis protein